MKKYGRLNDNIWKNVEDLKNTWIQEIHWRLKGLVVQVL